VDVIGLQCLDRARIKFSYLYGRHPCQTRPLSFSFIDTWCHILIY
jgi:hypothetical protein